MNPVNTTLKVKSARFEFGDKSERWWLCSSGLPIELVEILPLATVTGTSFGGLPMSEMRTVRGMRDLFGPEMRAEDYLVATAIAAGLTSTPLQVKYQAHQQTMMSVPLVH